MLYLVSGISSLCLFVNLNSDTSSSISDSPPSLVISSSSDAPLCTSTHNSYRNHSRRLRRLHQRTGSVADISIAGRGPAGVQKIHGCPALQVDCMTAHRRPCCNNERLFTAIFTVQQFHRASQFQFTREFTRIHNYGTDTDQSEAHLASLATDYTAYQR